MAELIIKTGKQREQTIPLPDSDIVIGRDEDCRIRLEAKGISHRHCFLKNSPNGWLIEDLGSRNGTFLNGKRIDKELLLKSGDIFSIGPLKFQFVEKNTSPGKTGKSSQSALADKNSAQTEMTTDDEIADWLMEDDQNCADVSEQEGKKPFVVDEPEVKKFQSIAEEAADIIRRYQETAD
jgi:pSer/pThr/pTyr-binding forkhead associated (FHA) protein